MGNANKIVYVPIIKLIVFKFILLGYKTKSNHILFWINAKKVPSHPNS